MDSRLKDGIRSSWPALCAGILVIFLGVVSLLGWIFDIETFKQFLHRGIAIKANTAIALILAGLSLCLFILDQQHRWSRRVGQLCAALVLIVGVMSLSEHLVGWNLGIDQILFHEEPGPPGSLPPGRPGPPASLCFVLGGIALLLLHERSQKYRVLLQTLAIGMGLIAAPGLIGYAYGIEALYGIAKYTAIAFHTALALLLLAAGILFAYPNEGIAAIVFDKGIGGSIARRLLPPAILVPLVLGWFRLRGEEQGYFVAAFGTAVMMLIMMTLLSTLVLRTAAVSRHSQRQQQLAEEALLMANQRLEQRVMERTDELRTAFRYARSLIEASLDPLVTISPEGKIMDVNKATELATGVSHERLIGSDFSDYFTEPHKANEGYLKVLSEGLVRDYPLSIRHVTGHITHVLYNATVYRNEAGETQGVFAAARDVTERKRVEEKLHAAYESLQQLAAIVESSDDAIIGKTLDGAITSWNHGAERIYGYTAGEAIGKHISLIIGKDRPNEVSEILDRIGRGLPVEHYETKRIRKDGQLIAVSMTVSPIKNATGDIIGASTIARDITYRKRMEEELRTASLYSRSLIEASLDPLVTISPEGKITDVNQASVVVTGVSPEQLIGSNFSEYFTEPEKANEGYQKVLAEGLVRDYPLTIRHASGRTTDVLYNATVYKNEAGQVQGVFAAARDITERKRAEQALRVASLYARGLLEASLDPLVTISHEGKITDVNQATELATGVARNDLIGSDFSGYFTEPQQADEGYRKVISEGFVRDYPLTIRHASGQTIDVLYNATVYKNEAGQVQGVFAAARDITERKRAEEGLTHYREHLEELVAQRTDELARSNKDLEQFAYVASHDLQEPLRMVAGYLQLLSERYRGQLDEKADKYIDYAVDGAGRMSTLIRDLLEYSRVNTQGEELRNVDCKKALESAMRNLGSAIKESGATVTHDSLPVVRADQTQLAQLFQNLIGNAIKFRSPQRPPQVHVSVRNEREHWLFRVEDNGIGFEQQYEDKIFMIFQRLHGRGQYPGTGVGLAICKRIVERHGGRIWAASEPDKGTSFFFTIPI